MIRVKQSIPGIILHNLTKQMILEYKSSSLELSIMNESHCNHLSESLSSSHYYTWENSEIDRNPSSSHRYVIWGDWVGMSVVGSWVGSSIVGVIEMSCKNYNSEKFMERENDRMKGTSLASIDSSLIDEYSHWIWILQSI